MQADAIDAVARLRSRVTNKKLQLKERKLDRQELLRELHICDQEIETLEKELEELAEEVFAKEANPLSNNARDQFAGKLRSESAFSPQDGASGPDEQTAGSRQRGQPRPSTNRKPITLYVPGAKRRLETSSGAAPAVVVETGGTHQANGSAYPKRPPPPGFGSARDNQAEVAHYSAQEGTTPYHSSNNGVHPPRAQQAHLLQQDNHQVWTPPRPGGAAQDSTARDASGRPREAANSGLSTSHFGGSLRQLLCEQQEMDRKKREAWKGVSSDSVQERGEMDPRAGKEGTSDQPASEFERAECRGGRLPVLEDRGKSEADKEREWLSLGSLGSQRSWDSLVKEQEELDRQELAERQGISSTRAAVNHSLDQMIMDRKSGGNTDHSSSWGTAVDESGARGTDGGNAFSRRTGPQRTGVFEEDFPGLVTSRSAPRREEDWMKEESKRGEAFPALMGAPNIRTAGAWGSGDIKERLADGASLMHRNAQQLGSLSRLTVEEAEIRAGLRCQGDQTPDAELRCKTTVKRDFQFWERIRGREVNSVAGLELHTSVLTPQEQLQLEGNITEWVRLGMQNRLRGRTFSAPRKSIKGKGRITVQFGCCYNYAIDQLGRRPGIIPEEVVEPMPAVLTALVSRLVRWGVLPKSMEPDSAIVNIYEVDDCIPPHIDHQDFSRPFCTVSLLSEESIMFGSKLIPDGPGVFHGINGQHTEILLPTGSCLVLKGNGADVAMHCVPPVSRRRMSITLRKMGHGHAGAVRAAAARLQSS